MEERTEYTKLRIFVSSPVDVLDERKRLGVVRDELNGTAATAWDLPSICWIGTLT